LQILNEVGISAIREKSIRMTQRLVDAAKSHGWRVNTPENPQERAGTVSIDCPNAQAVSRELLAREILIDYRPKTGIRLSPHFYNSEAECDFAISQIAEILGTSAWKRHIAESEPALT
jgi:kynureninase